MVARVAHPDTATALDFCSELGAASGMSQRATASIEHEGEGADVVRLSAATGDPGGLHHSDMRSAVLITYPSTHAYGHIHISGIYGYASPHGGAPVGVSH